MNPTAAAAEIVLQLRACTNPQRQAATQNYFPSAQENLGVYAADLRAIVRKWKPALKAEPAGAVLALAHALLAHNTLEGRQVAYELVAQHKPATQALNFSTLESLGQGIDNWASVDGFGCGLTGQAWREGRITDAQVRRWAKSGDAWWRRLALVSTVPLNLASRGGSGDAARTLAICDLLAQDKHIMVHKALSWALRTLVSRDPAAVKQFLKRHAQLPALVKREVSKKLATGRKNG